MSKITVATFNVHFGKNTDKIASAIKENENLNRADVLLLQEIEAHSKEEKERAHRIADKLGMHYIYAPARVIKKDDTHGLAILSIHPIKNHEVVQLDFFKLGIKSRTRIALNAEIEIGTEKVVVSNVHLDTRLNFPERAAQMLSVVRKLKQHHLKKIILGGDLNTIPFVWAKGAVPVGYDDQRRKLYDFMLEQGFKTKMGGIGYTIKSGPVKWSLDAIYTKGVLMQKCGVEHNVAISDHRPVWADIQIAGF
jgi:endonuclease/exonuclease/phosphatase family metal-dependent hydrolase